MILGASMLVWMTRLVAFAAAIAAIELLVVRRALSDTGVFAWRVLRRDYAPHLRAPVGLVLSYPSMLGVLALQLAAAVSLPWSDHPAPAWIVFGCALAVSVRFRGAFNGGSDSMLLVVTLSLAIARTVPAHAEIALAYCAAQLVLSYVIAGLVKLRDPAWRDGSALAILVELPQYRVPRHLAAILAPLSRIAAWAILAFEIAFPLVFASPVACAVFLAFGAAFHLANALVFGLNRFLFTWLAAYPALVYWVLR